MEAGEKDRQLAVWRARLGGEQPVLQLPAEHPRRADGRYRAAVHAWDLPADRVRALRSAAQARGITPFMALLAAFQAALYRWSGQQDVRVGVPVANRGRVETEGLVGLFVNTQVLRLQIDGRMPLSAALDAVREAALEAQAHQDLPFDQLVEALQPGRSLAAPPLFQVMFNYQQHDHRALGELPGLALERWDIPGQTAQFELILAAVEDGQGGLRLEFHYARELFEAGTVRRMAGHYEAVLAAVLQALEGTGDPCVGDVPLLAGGEARQLREWGDCPRMQPHAEPVHRLFERMARRQPDAVAVEAGDAAWSFRALDRRANHLAHRITALGAGPSGASVSRCRARPNWWRPCWPSSRRARPSCRWTRPIRPSAWPTWRATAAWRCCSPKAPWPGASRCRPAWPASPATTNPAPAMRGPMRRQALGSWPM